MKVLKSLGRFAVGDIPDGGCPPPTGTSAVVGVAAGVMPMLIPVGVNPPLAPAAAAPCCTGICWEVPAMVDTKRVDNGSKFTLEGWQRTGWFWIDGF